MAQRWISRLDFYDAPMPEQALIELAEDRRVLIEYHKGVCQYSPERICVNVKFGCVVITGQNLTLARMSPQQLVIVGKIQCIRLERKADK